MLSSKVPTSQLKGRCKGNTRPVPTFRSKMISSKGSNALEAQHVCHASVKCFTCIRVPQAHTAIDLANCLYTLTGASSMTIEGYIHPAIFSPSV